MKQNKILTPEEALANLNKPIIRKEIAKADFFLFLKLYFSHHIKYNFDTMHKEMINICQDNNISLALIMAFRGSGKSTIITTAFPLWAILGNLEKKYIVIVSKTKPQSRQIMTNIKSELESNEQLRKDLGPFQEESEEWGSESIVFSNKNSRITVVSIEQSLKGLRHKQYRPDIIILDDVEDNESTKSKEMRQKTYEKYTREIIPLGDKETRIFHVGNMLHQDSLIMKLSRQIKDDEKHKVFKRYPIIDDNGLISWKSKFSSLEEIEKERNKINDYVAWNLEYLLKIVSSNEQIIKNEEIQYYKELPQRVRSKSGSLPLRYIIVGVDLAISKNDRADYTALVPIMYEKDPFTGVYKAYVLPNFIHKRMDFNETVDAVISLNKSLQIYCPNRIIFVIETIAYQQALAQAVRQKENSYIEIVEKVYSIDKETRLRISKPFFSNKCIFFPEENGLVIVTEIVGFGKERHDDLVDSITLSLNYSLEIITNSQKVIIA